MKPLYVCLLSQRPQIAACPAGDNPFATTCPPERDRGCLQRLPAKLMPRPLVSGQMDPGRCPKPNDLGPEEFD